MALKRLTQGETCHLCSSERIGSIKITFDDILRNHVVALDLVDGLALPDLLHLVSGLLSLTAFFLLFWYSM